MPETSREVGTAMKFNTVKYFVKESFKSLKRNRTLSIASSLTVAATLFILGIFLLTILNVNQGVKGIESTVEVQVYLNDNISIPDKDAIEAKINSVDGIDSVTYETKAQSLQKMKDRLGADKKDILEGLDKRNPFPAVYTVKVKQPQVIDSVVKSVKGMTGIYEIKDSRQFIDKVISITKTVKMVGIVVFTVLIFVSVFLIGNTIKLTVYSRRREIGIMKYIGATDWFIRWPFIIEGMVLGLIGSIVANILLYYAYKAVYLKIVSSFMFMELIKPFYVLTTLSIEFIIAGMIIGAIGSIQAIRRFLAV